MDMGPDTMVEKSRNKGKYQKGENAIHRTTGVESPVIVDAGMAKYHAVLTDISTMLEQARRTSVRMINSIMTETYWQIGHRIVEHEQEGRTKAGYGRALVLRLGKDLSNRFGRGFAWRNLFQMRAFYLAYPLKLQTLSAISGLDEMHRGSIPKTIGNATQ